MNTDSAPLVGIVIPTLGTRPKWLRATMVSIAENRPAGVDVALVIVGPENEVVRSTADEFGAQLVVQATSGLSNAINLGWSAVASKAKYFTWLGDDDLLSPGSLQSTIDALDRNPRAGFVYGRTRYIDGNGESIYTSRPTRWAPSYMKVGKDFVPQPGSLIRVQAVTWELLVDAELRNAMDLDLFLRLASRTKWVYLPQEVSAYRLHGDAITSQKGHLDESAIVRNRYRSTTLAKIAGLTEAPRNFLEKMIIWIPWKMPNSKKYKQGGLYCLPADLTAKI